jgi:hypothetical protein
MVSAILAGPLKNKIKKRASALRKAAFTAYAGL